MTDFDTSSIEHQLQQAMTTHQVPGVAVSVVKAGNVAYAKGFGVTTIEAWAAPIQPDTLFRIGSVTKPLTGTMIMNLVQQGFLDLDKPIGEYVPELPTGRDFTLRMLLSHTSGLPSDLIYYPDRKDSLHDYVFQRVPQYTMVAPAGKVYFYSNAGINLAAYVAEVVMQIGYPELMQRFLFDPLQMSRSTFDLAMAATYPLAQPHIRDRDDRISVKRPHIDNPAEYPCGFAFSTALDMAKFMDLHLGYSKLLTAESLQTMHQTHVDRLDGTGYGLTFRTGQFRGIRYVGHNGAIGKYGAIMRLHPDQELGIFMVFNRAPGFWGAAGNIVNQYVTLLLDLPEITMEADITPPQDEALFGTYLGYQTGVVKIDAHGVHINGEKADKAHIGRADDDYIMVNGVPCERQKVDLQYDCESDLSIYTGVYHADIDTWIVSVSSENTLTIYSEDDRDDVVYRSIGDHRFAGDGSVIVFEFDSTGQVTGLLYANGYRFRRQLADSFRKMNGKR